MTQTLAIFVDAYRNLNSKKLFWVTVGLSGLVAASFALVGLNDHGVGIAFWQFDSTLINSLNIPRDQFYQSIFSVLGIKYWCTWLATLLALVSTAGIFPDLLSQGSIDMFVSKPISRVRLFMTEYVAGLLFVILQITIFSLASFLVLGLRGGVWLTSVFWAVPIVVCFFSYLYGFCVLIGVWTRSTIAALLFTIFFWSSLFCIDHIEQWTLAFANAEESGVSLMPQNPREAKDHSGATKHRSDKDIEDAGIEHRGNLAKVLHNVLYGMKTCLPKTGETVGLLDRVNRSMAVDHAEADEHGSSLPSRRRFGNPNNVVEETNAEIAQRPLSWVIGTSLCFEFIVVALAAWIFCRRDY